MQVGTRQVGQKVGRLRTKESKRGEGGARQRPLWHRSCSLSLAWTSRPHSDQKPALHSGRHHVHITGTKGGGGAAGDSAQLQLAFKFFMSNMPIVQMPGAQGIIFEESNGPLPASISCA